MDSKKIALMAIAVVAIGIFALPSTVSLFSGQHSWYNLNDWSAGHTTVPCEKCHADIAAEMETHTGPHTELSGSWSGGSFSRLYCEDCHRVFFSYNRTEQGQNPADYSPKYTYALGGTGSTPGKEAHAASTVECMDCHGVVGDEKLSQWGCPTAKHTTGVPYSYGQPCKRCHYNNILSPEYAFVAGGFGLIKGQKAIYGFQYDPANDTGERAAHKQFVLDAMEDDLMEGANEACIACHTRVGVNITWTKKVYLEFTAIENEAGNWTIASFTAGGTNVTYVNTSNSWTNP